MFDEMFDYVKLTSYAFCDGYKALLNPYSFNVNSV